MCRLTLKVLILVVVTIFFGCIRKTQFIEIEKKNAYKSIETVSDSIFFKNVGLITNKDSKIYILDNTHKRIVLCDKDLKYLNFYGKGGKGPGELLYPSSFEVCDDRSIIIRDGKNIQFFDEKGEFIVNWKTDFLNLSSKLAVDREYNLYVSTPDKKLPISVFNKQGELINNFGQEIIIEGSSQVQKYTVNDRHLFITENNRLVAVSLFQPIIEIYNTLGELLIEKHFDNQIVNSRLEYANEKQKSNPQTTVQLFSNAYFYKNKLFIMALDHINTNVKVTSNKIIVFDITERQIKINKIIELNSSESNLGFFTAFCVFDNNQLLAYDHLTGSFRFFKL